jgi:hypothetical protein
MRLHFSRMIPARDVGLHRARPGRPVPEPGRAVRVAQLVDKGVYPPTAVIPPGHLLPGLARLLLV